MRHIIVLLALLCASCSSSLPSIKPYKMDIQQGNVVTSKMMLQLRPGMTRSQVRFIMGTPLIQDSFHKDRWDYFYQMRKEGKIIEQRRVILEFDKDALLRVRGDVVPAGTGQDLAEPTAVAAPVTGPGRAPTKAPAAQPDKKGVMDKLKFWKNGEDKVEKPQAAPAELVTPQVKEPVPSQQAVPAQPAAEAAPVPVAPEPAPAVEATPEAAPEPASAQEPVPQKQTETPVQQPAPVAKPAVKPETAAKPAPEPAATPEKELPPEDEPGYFERMLEKIGF